MPLSIRRQDNWLNLIDKAADGLWPSYLSVLSFVTNNSYNLRSNNSILFNVPTACSELGKMAYVIMAFQLEMQKKLTLDMFIPLSDLKWCVVYTLHYKCEIVSRLFFVAWMCFLFCLLCLYSYICVFSVFMCLLGRCWLSRPGPICKTVPQCDYPGKIKDK